MNPLPPTDGSELPPDPISDPDELVWGAGEADVAALASDDASHDDAGQMDIVRRQFQKNRAAVWGLRVSLALAHVAIFAPLIASGDPFVYQAPGAERTYPWFSRLFDVLSWEHGLDRAFNALMIVIVVYWIGFLVSFAFRVPRRRTFRSYWRKGAIAVAALAFLLQVTGLGFTTSHKRLDYRAPINAVRAAKVDLRAAEAEGDASVLPALREALAEAQAERAKYTIRTTPIPYGYREMLPLREDKFLTAWTIEDDEIHLFGTGETGRDIFARILYGTRISLTIGIVAVGIYVTIGTILGALAGYFRGRVDMVIMRIVEIVICIPGLFLMLTIVSLFEKRSIMLIMFAIGVVAWTGITRLVRGEFLRERNMEYVEAARVMGFGTPRIIFRHILPNALGPVLVAATFGIPGAILAESGLSFLGLGDVSVPSWGRILYDARTHEHWHLIIPPSVAIFITVTALNLVGDGLRDALDPKLRA